MLAMKAIKPQRMRDDRLRLALLNATRRAGTAIRRDFAKTTATWEHKPTFEEIISLTGPGPVIVVGTDDKIYRYVNDGTRPHPIFAGIYTGKSNKKALRFAPGSQPKTQPRVIGSTPGAPGSGVVMTPYVQHPGTKAREFDEEIARIWKIKFKRWMEDAMREAAKESGHGG